MTIKPPDAPALLRRRVLVIFGAEFLAAFAGVELAGSPQVERLADGKDAIALPAFVTAPAGAFPAEGERVDVGVNIIDGRAVYVTGLQRRAPKGRLDT